jgi:glycosyltransferase involved in cell wall biosynthesis
MEPSAPLISIVIPARNSRAELKLCLEAVRSLKRRDLEVIVVDDASEDDTAKVAKDYGCILVAQPNRCGPAAARNRGVEVSRGEIIVFIDSDIIISEKAISSIVESFSRDGEAAAVVGMLDERCMHRNLPSQYFNLRKHYDYLLINDDLTNLYTSITAIRKDVFLKSGGFDVRYTGTTGEDAELGRRLWRLGHRIVLNKEIKVTHLKHHTLKSLLKSDFTRASHFMKFLLRERLAGDIAKKKRFGSFRLGSLTNVSVVPVLTFASVSLPFFYWAAAPFYICAFIFVLANFGFLTFTSKVVGWRKNLVMPLIIFIDSLAVFIGILFGLVSFLKGNRF